MGLSARRGRLHRHPRRHLDLHVDAGLLDGADEVSRAPRSILPILLVASALAFSACGAAETPAGDVPTVPTESTEPSTTVGSTDPDDRDDSDDGVGAPSEEELAAVLAAVATHRVTVDNSFGGGTPFERVEVIETIGETNADGMIDARDGRPLSDAERAAIETALAPLPVAFVPTTVFEDLDPADDPGGRAIVTLAEPAEVDGRPAIASQLWCGGLCGIGGAHELVRVEDGTWTIGEPIGPQWIS